jgi:hypothetical protein
VDSIVDSLFQILTATQPAEIHALDLAATHGRDHSGHLFSSAFALWAAARVRYDGPIRWHRGYNVVSEAITLDDADYQLVRPMLGYFDACYFGTGRCGSTFDVLDPSHDGWLRRPYSSDRGPLELQGTLALDGASVGACVVVAAGKPTLGDCAAAATVHLDPGGHLTIDGACLASPPGNDDPVVLAPCQDSPSQYWLADTERMVWNGRPPVGVPDMDYDHVRCLDAGAAPGAPLTAPICGEHRQPRWRVTPTGPSGLRGGATDETPPGTR